MKNKEFQSVINLDGGGTAALSLDITYFPQLPVQTTKESLKVLVNKFLDSILPNLISSMKLSCESEVNLVIHSVIPLPVGKEGITYQCGYGLKVIIAEEKVETCAKYQDKPHYHYLCQVVMESGASSGDEAGLETGKRVKINEKKIAEDSTTDDTIYGDFLKIPELPLHKIFSYLDLEDLKNISVLSKDLLKLVLPSLISSSSLRFGKEDEIPDLLHFIQSKVKPLNKNTSLTIDSKTFEGSSETPSMLLKLFTGCGPYISHLKISNHYDYGYYGKKVVLSGFKDNTWIPVSENKLFPSLTSIEINGYGDASPKSRREDKNEGYFPLFKSILENAPALKEVKVACGGVSLITSLLFRLIGESGLDITILKVKNAIFTDTHLSYLEPLNLEQVDFDFAAAYYKPDMPATSAAVTKFLENQRHTLKHISFEGGFLKAIPQFSFPRMELLETLKFKSNKIDRIGGPNTPIIYENQLPKLKRLEFEIKDGVKDEEIFPAFVSFDQEPTTSVKEVILKLSSVNLNNLKKCISVFKCLSKLEIPFDVELVKVWKDLVGLEELTLLPITDIWHGWSTVGTFIDEVITGIEIGAWPGDYCKVFTDEEIQDYEKDYAEFGIDQSLAVLKKLKLLRLRPAKKEGVRLLLTDISFLLVLSKMESLKCIDFCGIHSSIVGTSKKVLDEVGKKISLLFGDKRDWYY